MMLTKSWPSECNFGIYLRSAVGIATGYGLDNLEVGVRVPVRSRIFFFPCCPDQLWALSSGVKRPGREADNSPPTSTDVKKMWIYTSTPSPYAFMA
jgi:hypothetical protein